MRYSIDTLPCNLLSSKAVTYATGSADRMGKGRKAWLGERWRLIYII
jgi:hypothetical protein